MRWERVACWAETRRSHSSARAVARCGFEGGMRRGVLRVGLRTARVSRWIVWLFSESERGVSFGGVGVLELMFWRRLVGRKRTIIRLYAYIFPESLLHCCTRLHGCCSQVLAALEKLSLPPPSVDSFSIL